MTATTDLQILGAKLAALTEEMCLTLQRTSRSLYVKETADFACAIADRDGNFIAYPNAIGGVRIRRAQHCHRGGPGPRP